MPEIIYAHIACKLTDKCSVSIVNAFRNAYDQIRHFPKCFFHIGNKFLRIKCHLRQVDQHRIVSLEFPCKDAGRRQPSGVASHDLHDGDRLLIVIY